MKFAGILLGLLFSSFIYGQNVGIGTLTPLKELHVDGTTLIEKNASAGDPQLEIQQQGTGYGRIYFTNSLDPTYYSIASNPQSNPALSKFSISYNGLGDQLTLTGNNRMGIRTSSPAAALHINGMAADDPLRVQINGATKFRVYNNGAFTFGSNWNTPIPNVARFNLSNMFIGYSSSHVPLERLEVDGAIVVGTTSTATPANGTIRSTLTDIEAYVGGGWKSMADSDWAKNGSHQYSVNGGNVGIGLILPSEKLDVDGAIQIANSSSETPEAGTIRWNSTSGDFEGYTGTQWKSLTMGSGGNNEVSPYSNDWGIVPASKVKDEYHPVTSPSANSDYGEAMDFAGSFFIVGAPSAHMNGFTTGAAYIYSNFAAGIVEESVLLPDNNENNKFGFAVAMQGEYAVVGAPFEDNGSLVNAGAAYIFKKDTGLNTWSFHDKIVPDDPDASETFGRSVDIFGNYVIVGCQYDNNSGGSSAGSAYVFERNGNTWSQINKLVHNAPAAFDQFGKAVTIDANYAIVGAHQDDENGLFGVGSISVFKKNGGSFQYHSTIHGDLNANLALYGSAVDQFQNINGHYLAVSSPSFEGRGRVYIYEIDNNLVTLISTVDGPDSALNDEFGFDIDITLDNLVVSAVDDDNYGSVYLFERNGTIYEQVTKLQAIDSNLEHKFGSQVRLTSNNSKIFITAPKDDDEYNNGGSIYTVTKND